MTQTTPGILQRAKELFWAQSESFTGHRWNWDDADAEIQSIWINHALRGTRAPLKEAP